MTCERKVAIEFRSFSKNIGFTGVRCALTVVPEKLTTTLSSGETVSLHQLWKVRFAYRSFPVLNLLAPHVHLKERYLAYFLKCDLKNVVLNWFLNHFF